MSECLCSLGPCVETELCEVMVGEEVGTLGGACSHEDGALGMGL